jgi:hypothetical protein
VTRDMLAMALNEWDRRGRKDHDESAPSKKSFGDRLADHLQELVFEVGGVWGQTPK